MVLALVSLLVLFTGRAGAAEPLSLNMDHFDFGAKNVGGEMSEPGEFVVTNVGGTAVELGLADTTPTDPRVFWINRNFDFCSFETLQPGESCDIVTVFEPSIAGEFTGTLQINSESLGSPVVATLEGIAYPALRPDVKLTPNRLDFGTHGTGTDSEPRTIEVKNTGQGDMSLGASEIGGANSADFRIVDDECAGIVMASGSVCEVKAVFRPRTAGIRNASLHVPTDVAGADTDVPLTGTGAGIVPDPDPDPELPGTATVKIAKRLPSVKGRKLRLPVACEVLRMDRCRGTIVTRAGGRDGRARFFGRAGYSVIPGKAVVTVRLNENAGRALGEGHPLRVTFSLRVRQGTGEFASRSVKRTLRRRPG